MEIVRDDPNARWLPSRHRFALAKLVARFVLSRTEREAPRAPGIDRLLLAIDRDQSALETYSVCIWFCATTILYIAAVLPVPFRLAIFLAIPLAALAIEIPIYLLGNSFVLMLLLFAASLYFVTTSGPAFYIALFSLTLFVTNWTARLVNAICGI
ncbi:MAG TPA: hypothetical protein VL284_03200 [Thermoanaerobaculia bacterium]|nr:hypothetical protein [Thermoanaerobaculia bacterium]